jgi:dihydrodipicolinate synthase/N-acetylneuraminate lyase
MIPSYVYGPIANVFTAWQADGRFDPAGQRNTLDFLARSGAVSAYFVRSGMGQMYAYELEDVKAMATLACTHMRGRGPVLVGTAGIWDRNFDRRPDPALFTRQAVELSRFAEDQGADGVVHTMPEAIAPGDGETCADVTLRYFETVCAAVRVPVFIYQPPATRPEYCVTMDLAARLADMPAVMGMKVSTDDAAYVFDICYAVAGKDFAFISGSERAFLAGLYCGSRACIGQGSSVNPVIIRAIQQRYDAGDRHGAIEAQHSVNMLCRESKAPVEFLKRYATEKGLPVPPYHRPMPTNPAYGMPDPLTDDQYRYFKRVLEAELAKYT